MLVNFRYIPATGKWACNRIVGKWIFKHEENWTYYIKARYDTPFKELCSLFKKEYELKNLEIKGECKCDC